MKKYLLFLGLLSCTIHSIGQNKIYKSGITCGAFLQHYNGNLGNSFFKFRTVAFGGGSIILGKYLNSFFDLNVGLSAGDFGYCQMESDKNRIVSIGLQCPGCTDMLGMGQLRARMVSGNLGIKFKFANNIFLKENSKFAPYIYGGLGVNQLSDFMGKQCVNVGTHFTANGGAGIMYNITNRINIGYNLGLGCFLTKKVYITNADTDKSIELDEDEIKIQKRKDLYLQNSLFIGINLH